MNTERDTSGVRIRPAVAEDSEAIASVLRESFAEYEALYTPEGFAATTPASVEVSKRVEEGPVWVALDEDEAFVGTVSVVSKGEALYVRGMAVTPAARGRRVGELLLRRAEDFAREHNFKRIFLSTTPFLHRAIKLYERHGYRRTQEAPHDLHGTPLFTMEKPL